MPASRVDRDKLRTRVRVLSGEGMLVILDRAIDLLPASKLAKLVEGYVSPTDLLPDGSSSPGLVEAVKTFRAASLMGEYYESFDVNWRNSTQKSRGTTSWIAECHRLLERCVSAAAAGRHADARQAFDLVFDLLRRIDERPDDIIFFADEAGSWQVGVNWGKVLPAYFRCLSRTAEPADYARAATGIIGEFVDYHSERYLRRARAAANAAQKKALRGA